MNDEDVRRVWFNGIELSNFMKVNNLNVNNYPQFEIRRYKVAHADRSITTSKEAVSKDITVKGVICAGNRSTKELNLLLLKMQLWGTTGQLQVTNAGMQVLYTATCEEIDHEWDKSNIDIEIRFVCSTPYGRSLEQTTLVLPNITGAAQSISLQGTSVSAIRPEITLQFDSVTDGTNKTVTIRNSETQLGISINNDFVTGDTLYIDSYNMVVTLNGTPVDFTGAFPIFKPNITSLFIPSMHLDYIDDLTDRDINGTFAYHIEV